MTVFARQIANTKVKIAKKGETCKYSVLSDPQGLPWRPDEAEAVVPIDVEILWIPPSRSDQSFIEFDRRERGQASYKTGLMAQQLFNPRSGDIATQRDGTDWTLIQANKLDPDGDVILWTLVFAR